MNATATGANKDDNKKGKEEEMNTQPTCGPPSNFSAVVVATVTMGRDV